MKPIVLFLITSSLAQSPTCGSANNYAIALTNYPPGFGSLIYTFPTRAFATAFTISGASTKPDLFDFYILNGSQYHESPYTWDDIHTCSDAPSTCALNVSCGTGPRTTFSDAQASTNLMLLFVCRNPVGACDIWLNVTLEGNGPDCAPGCPSYDLGNSVCNPMCYNSACQYDGGDCLLNHCSAGCPITSYQNGNCDLGCNNSACNFDGGDCTTASGTRSATTSTASPSPGSRSPSSPSPMTNTGSLRRLFS
jgi:hypothetical protein